MAAAHKKGALDVILGTASFGTSTTAGAACTGDKVQIQKIIDEFKKRGYYQLDNARTYVCFSLPPRHHFALHSHTTSLLTSTLLSHHPFKKASRNTRLIFICFSLQSDGTSESILAEMDYAGQGILSPPPTHPPTLSKQLQY